MSPSIKITILGAVTTVFAGLLGYVFGLTLSGGALLWLMIIGIIFGALYLTEVLAISSKKLLAGLSFAHAVFFAVFMFSAPTFYFYGLVILAAVILALSAVKGRKALENSLTPNVSKVASLTLPLASSALAVIMTFVYVTGFAGRDFTLPKSSIEGLLRPVESPLRGFVPGFTLDMSVRDFIKASLEARTPAELRGLPREVKDQLIRESETQSIKTISDILKIPVSPTESILDVLHRAASAQLIKIPPGLRLPILLGFGLLVFLTIKGFAVLLRYPITWLAIGLYKLFLAVGFLRVVEEDIKRQIIAL